MCVYFIKDHVSGLIKIGYSNNPRVRFNALKSQHPKKDLELLRVIENGDKSLEKVLHLNFDRIENEWCKPDTPLMDYIANPYPVEDNGKKWSRKRQKNVNPMEKDSTKITIYVEDKPIFDSLSLILAVHQDRTITQADFVKWLLELARRELGKAPTGQEETE